MEQMHPDPTLLVYYYYLIDYHVCTHVPCAYRAGQRHKLVNASKHKITVGDNVAVYGMWFDPGQSVEIPLNNRESAREH